MNEEITTTTTPIPTPLEAFGSKPKLPIEEKLDEHDTFNSSPSYMGWLLNSF